MVGGNQPLKVVELSQFSKKLSHIKHRLRLQSKFSFGSTKLQKLSILRELENLDISKESHSLTTTEFERGRNYDYL